MRTLRTLAVLFALLAPLLPAAPASAAHPCAQTSDGFPYDGYETSGHDGCDYYLGDPAAFLGEASDGGSATVPAGRTVLVQLAAAPAGQVWSQVRSDDGGPLYRVREVVSAQTGYALFQARRVGTAVVTATTSCLRDTGCPDPARQWSATVQVTAGDLRVVTPSCRRTPPSTAPDTTVVTEAQDGATVTVTVGRRLRVALSGCAAGGGLLPAEADGLLVRETAVSQQPGASSILFLATRVGRTTVTARADAPCAHDATPCATDLRFRLTVDVVAAPDCAQPDSAMLTADPAQVAPGDRVTVSLTYQQPCGTPREHSLPLTAVQTDLERQVGTFTTRAVRTDTAALADTPTATTEYRAGGAVRRVDVAGYYGSCAGAVALSAPASARPGAPVRLEGTTTPGAPVQLLFRRTGTGHPLAPGWVVRRTLVADASGAFQTSYAAVGDEDVYAQSGRCSSRPTTARVSTTVSGPASARRGTDVALLVRGAAGEPVRVLFRAAGAAGYAVRRTRTLDARGVLRVTYRADTDQRWYAVAGRGADVRTSPAGRTRAT